MQHAQPCIATFATRASYIRLIYPGTHFSNTHSKVSAFLEDKLLSDSHSMLQMRGSVLDSCFRLAWVLI